MRSSERLPGAVAEALARGAAVVTANQRAARTLRLEFERERVAEGLASWRPPVVLAWEAWTAGLWAELLVVGWSEKLLLNPVQELAVWRSVIEADEEFRSLAGVEGLAAMAAKAWGLLGAFGVSRRMRATGMGSDASEDTRAFRRWEAGFRRRCETEGYLTGAELEAELARAVREGGLKASGREILLVGFDKTTPAQELLLGALGEAGAAVGAYRAEEFGELRVVAAQDSDAELRAAAGWLRELLLGVEEGEPVPRVAVIAPGVGEERGEIERVFREVLSPERLPITAGDAGGPYEFSLGSPLARNPMVATALELLRWAAGALPIDAVSWLLLAPSFLVAGERGARAEFDAFELRQMRTLRPEVGLKELAAMVGRSERATRLEGLARQLNGLRRAAERLIEGAGGAAAQRSYTEWAEAFGEMLEAAGWATRTAAGQDSVGFQTRRKWEAALDQLATLDFEGGRRSFAEARQALERVLEGMLFAPESREAPIQIMGPLEAAGSSFDVVWFLRAGDGSWPLRSAANPLLGWGLQRQMRMPGADPAVDREHALGVTERIARSAETVIFSYAVRDAKTAEVRRVSGVVEGLALIPLELGGPLQLHAGADQVELEGVADEGWIPLLNQEVRGGAAVLQAQAACGFRAFAERRLWSSGLDLPTWGMDAAERGNMVHGTLEEFWAEVQTQKELKAMSAEARVEVLDRAIQAAMGWSPGGANVDSSWTKAFLETQRERLRRLLGPWLEQELGRGLEFRVRQREDAKRGVEVGPLRLNLRMDRVDETEFGDVLIDYKTGPARAADWAGERPDQPQLPLYAMLSEAGPLAAVAFARIQPGKKMGLDGFAAAPGIVARPAEMEFATLGEQVEEWRRILTRLAEEFAAGDARVRPKSYPQTCTYCKQRLLCRLDPATLVDEVEADEAGELESEGING